LKDDLDDILVTLERGRVLPIADAARTMIAIAEGQCESPAIARFLRAYNRRAPEAHELSAFVQVLRARMVRVQSFASNTLCNCGTGGDGRGTINVSTIAAFIIAASGVPVAKHGNRSVSSRSGSTDCLTAMGIQSSRDPAHAERLLSEHGLCFLNAPDFHPALSHASGARRELAAAGERSIFNLLGPMLNPAGVSYQSMGVYAPEMMRLVAKVLMQTGSRRAYVIHGDGFDEMALTGASWVCEVRDGEIGAWSLMPEDVRLRRCVPEDLRGGDPAANARIAEEILVGRSTGPMTDIALLNAAMGIALGSEQGRTLLDALQEARECVRSGRAYAKLCDLRRAAPIDA